MKYWSITYLNTLNTYNNLKKADTFSNETKNSIYEKN